MSKEEIKDEINKVLDQLTDKTLEDLLSFLKKIEEKHSITLFDRDRLEKILEEDNDLLKKLAK
jgi:hypothetical protein